MTIIRQVTGVLAWVGLAVVIAVPAAELVLSKLGRLTSAQVTAATVETTAAPVVTVTPKAVIVTPGKVAAPLPQSVATAAPVTPIAQPTPAPASASPVSTPAAADASPNDAAPTDPVKDYLATGKPLPSYLTPSTNGAATSQAQATAAPERTTPAAVRPVASSNPAVVVATTDDSAADPPQADDVAPPVPMPASARPIDDAPITVTEDDLKGWKSGSLEDYLRQHGLLNGANAPVTAGN